MPYRAVTKPIPFPRAFSGTSDAAILSQAAILLLMEPGLRRNRAMLAGYQSARRALKVPALSTRGQRVKVDEVESPLGLKPLSAEKEALPATRFRRLASDLGKKPNILAAANLMEASLRHPHALVRASAALSYFTLTAEPSRLIGILEDCTHSDDALVRKVAATGLARLAPESPRLFELSKQPSQQSQGSSTHTSLLVHGTWAANEQRWKPGGNFHSYLANGIRPDLYGNVDAFSWSGIYSEAARAMAAVELQVWLAGHTIQDPYLLTHSHGGSVAMLATQNGLNTGPLVLMSCPVHSIYMPDFARAGPVVSIRVKLDLVILADGGGQKFSDPRIREKILPIWFDHFATHDPAVWQRYNLPSVIPP
jgi:Alpha/beta hydrolase family